MLPRSTGLLLLAITASTGCLARTEPTPEPLPASTAAEPAVVEAAPPPAETAPVAAPAASCPEGMALVPAGTYRMQKRHRPSTVEAFCIDVTEVTVAAYKACVREGKCSPECLAAGTCSSVPTRAEWGDPDESTSGSRFCNGDRDDRQDHPVNCVSWEESANYCDVRGKRLPRPEEWEWAARRAHPRMWYPWGNVPATGQPCWGPKGKRRTSTCAVGTLTEDRTPQGVVDMAGNVSEWVDAKRVPFTRVRTAFGASWWSTDDGYVSGALGGVEVPSTRNETIGFRCARDVADAR